MVTYRGWGNRVEEVTAFSEYAFLCFLLLIHVNVLPVRTSLVAQWLRIRLPMQGTWVRALVQEDPTCCRATKPVRHNY